MPEDAGTPDTLYHYTRLAGLEGILHSESLWANDIKGLNDVSEFEYSRVLAREYIAGAPVTDWRLQHVAGIIDGTLGFVVEKSRLFVCCFSAACDSLTQWRAYGDNGDGFCLGFTLPDGLTVEGASDLPMAIFRVSYDAEEQIRWLGSAIGQFIRQMNERSDFSHGLQLVEAFRAEILGETIRFKHPAFRDENEWRILIAVPLDRASILRSRAGVTDPIDYLPLTVPDGRLPLREIVYGPGCVPAKTEAMIEDMLAAGGFAQGEVSVRGSAIPYRR